MAILREMHPRAPLDRFVASVWTNERGPLAHARERLIPTGCADIVIPLTDAPLVRFPGDAEPLSFARGLVSSATTSPAFRDTSTATSVVGIHFRPGGLAAFLRMPVDRLGEEPRAVDDVFGGAALELRERLGNARDATERLAIAERWLLDRLVASRDRDPLVDASIRSLADDPSGQRIHEFVAASGVSPTTFIDRFRGRVGLPPKRFARAVRIRRVCDALARNVDRPSLARLASEAGFSDQAHLAREFRSFTGLTPTEYAPIDGQPTHVPEVRTRPVGISFKTHGPRPR